MLIQKFAQSRQILEGMMMEKRSQPLLKAYQHQRSILKDITKQAVDSTLSRVHKICNTPFDDTSIIPSNIVFATVRDQGYSVAITGDGADELFCGYQSFSYLHKFYPILNKRFDGLGIYLELFFPNDFLVIKGETSLEYFWKFERDMLINLTCNGFKLSEQLASGYNVNSDYDPTHYVKKILDDNEHLDVMNEFRLLNLSFKLPNQMLYKESRQSVNV